MDRQILDKAKALKAARDQVAASLVKMEEKRAEVKASVYQKVHAEYEAKLNEAKKELATILPQILSRGQELARSLEDHRKKLDEASEEEDELTLRHHIGEVPDDEYSRRIAEIHKRTETVRSDTERAQADVSEIAGAFKDEPGFSQVSSGSAAVPPAEQPTIITTPKASPASHAAPAQAAPPKERKTAGVARQSGVHPAMTTPAPPPPPSRELIEEALGDPFGDVAAADIAGASKPFFTNPTLIVRSKGEETSYLLDLGEVVIGKSAENDIVLDDDSALAKHAVVRFEQDHYVIQAFANDGQLSVNDKSQKRAALADGDRVRIGKSEITFRNVRYEYDV